MMRMHHTGTFLLQESFQLFADFLYLLFLSPGDLFFLFRKDVSAVAVDSYYKRPETFDADLPERFSHTQVHPFHTGDLFYTCSADDCIACRKHTVDCTEFTPLRRMKVCIFSSASVHSPRERTADSASWSDSAAS